MRKARVVIFFLFAMLLMGAQTSHAHSHVFIGGSFAAGPYWGGPYYDPWYYGPSYGPYPYYYAPPDYGYLRTKIEPKEAEVWVDGRFFGTADQWDGWFKNLKLPLGLHTAQFKLRGYQSYTISFNMTPGDTTTVEHELTPVPEGQEGAVDYGTLKIKTEPMDTKIYIDGRFSTATGDEWGENGVSFPLPPGRHDVRITKPGFEEYTAQVMVSSGTTVNLDVQLKQQK